MNTAIEHVEPRIRARITVLAACLGFAACSGGKAARPPPSPTRPSSPPEVFLNHIYVVLDEASFDAARSSGFLRTSFARIDEGLPHFKPIGSASHTMYIRGEHTYIELFGPANPFKLAPGNAGVGFGVERAGSLRDLFAATRREGLKPGFDLGFVDFDVERPFAWKYTLYVKDELPGPRFAFWTTEYHPEMTATLFPGTPGAGGIARRDFLGPNYDQGRALNDVVGLRLALSPPALATFSKYLRAAGYDSTERAGGAVTFTGRDVVIAIDPATTADEGIRGLELRLNAAANAKHALGSSELVLTGNRGTWTFAP